MGQSLIVPAALPAGTITHAASDSVIKTEMRDGRMIHTITERGLTAEYPVRYQIGGRLMGRTYMVQIGDYLFESPASWFNRYGWDLSPGYSQRPVIDFDRPMEEQCLFCHAGAALFSDTDGRRLRGSGLTAITCERCHGSGEAHVRNPSARNIVNPAKLTGARRDSVCEQCHLEGAIRVLNPGKNWSDFHAGEATESTFATYLLKSASGVDVIAVSQAEQLAESKCARQSGGKLWCGSCHDPHGAPADRVQQIRSVCLTCHAQLTQAAHPGAHNAPAQECTTCHMPKSPTTDIPHAAVTDHRLRRRPLTDVERSGNPTSDAQTVVAWREPAQAIRERNLSLAEVVIGYTKKLPDIGQKGFAGLDALPRAVQDSDPIVVSDLEGLAMQQDNFAEALRLGKRSIELQPASAKAAMNYGLVLKQAGELAEAEHQLTRAVGLDPSLKQAYIELATLYASQREMKNVSDTIERFLKWNPQDVMFRLQRARLGTQP